MKIDQVLQTLGLQDREPDVYLTLLKTPGAQPASVIATRADLNRTTVYKILVKLVKRGLVTKTQRHGITCFFAEDPENRLKLLIEERQKQLTEMNQAMLEALPLLTMSEEETDSLPKIRYYEGIEGIKQIYEAVLKEEKDVYRYGDITKIYEALGIYTDEYIKKRNELGITTHAIMPYYETERAQIKKNTKENRDVLYIPKKLFPIEGEVRIFGNKVGIISLRKDSPIGVMIESDTISKMFLSIFMLTWKNYGAQATRMNDDGKQPKK
ncbi:helix-turn-helix domain-containing protein [Candidatus Peregrinibacteria bacterium]|nr:helix-turn-helix domain-containing protein [Candidatus Peregrinibacteria bacterium]